MEKQSNLLYSVLYIDDEVENLQAFDAAFRRYYKIFTAKNPQEALNILNSNNIQVILSDQRMPQMTGVQFLEAVTPIKPDALRMIVTAYMDVNAIIDAINHGKVYGYITKPWDEMELKKLIDSGLKIHAINKLNNDLIIQLNYVNVKQEKLISLFKKYVPKTIISNIIGEKKVDIDANAEFRNLSVLYIKLNNLVNQIHGVDPEKLLKFLSNYLGYLTDIVASYKGTVINFMGSEALICFGAPVADLENTVNAVSCGLHFAEDWRSKEVHITPPNLFSSHLEPSFAVTSGGAITCDLGSLYHLEYSVVGEIVKKSKDMVERYPSFHNKVLIDSQTFVFISKSSLIKFFVTEEIGGMSQEKDKLYILSQKLPFYNKGH